MNEIKAITQVCTTGHENIVQVLAHGWLLNSPYYFIDMPLCCINLEHYINGDFTDKVQLAMDMEQRFHHQWILWLDDDKVFGRSTIIFSEIVDGLGFIHRRKLIHRDLKPRNGSLFPPNCSLTC